METVDIVLFVVLFAGIAFSLWLAPRIIKLRGPRLKAALRLAIWYMIGYVILVVIMPLQSFDRHVAAFLIMVIPLGRMMKKTYGKRWKTIFVLCLIPMILGALVISVVLIPLKILRF